ncbi:fungal-specific transcription factor domain-containing protein [Trichoderma asperelloides]|nr:fungal-specific transcription factor domain-containing protein [Trichoderma asperelloides]
MSQNMPASKNAGLARFACTHCRQKKIKCSREFPKCAACRPWPGECIYHRLNPIAQSDKLCSTNEPAKLAANTSLQYSRGVDQRLSRVEKALETLSETINTSLNSVNKHGDSITPPTTTKSDNEAVPSYQPSAESPELTLDESHSFAYLGEASRHLELIKSKSLHEQLAEHQAASTALQDLSKSLTTINLQPPYNDTASFEFINDFLQNVQLAEVLFITPSEEILLSAIFNPATVPQRAWIVYINFILLSLLQHDVSQADIVENLKKNTNLALNDFRIFLEPSETNIQALMLLGCHGEQYASPNLSWMLVGHACRQAQAVGLHSLKSDAYEQRQRRLALFWSLFSVDKSCSLAFGRPMLLPTAIYEYVPLPDFQYLLKYHPHRKEPVETENGPIASTFGAHFFIQGMKLAKLTGAVLDFLANPGNLTSYQSLTAQLQSWDSVTNELLLKAINTESASSSTHQLQEMMIGVRAMRFQYLHILILLLRKDPNDKGLRIQAAQDAITLLPGLVSNSTHVYNGLVWQLLYYPFTPFFTIFGHIITHPSSPTANQDIELLNQTATYFNSMKQLGSLSDVSSKLERTALVFYNLARFITSKEHADSEVQGIESTIATTSTENTPAQEMDILSKENEVDFESYTDAFMAYINDQDNAAQPGFDNIDIENILGCLESDGTSIRTRKRSFESTLDWFSWDSHYYKD